MIVVYRINHDTDVNIEKQNFFQCIRDIYHSSTVARSLGRRMK